MGRRFQSIVSSTHFRTYPHDIIENGHFRTTPKTEGRVMNRNMKTLMVVVVLGLGLLAIASSGDAFQGQEAAPTTVLHQVSSGGFADVAFADDLQSQFLAVTSDTTGSNSNAVLIYHGVAFDPTSQVCSDDPVLGTFCRFTRKTEDFADAFISPNDVTITANTARLNTDLALASAFFFSRCVVDDLAGTTECTDVLPSGFINLEWRKTGASSVRLLGNNEVRTGPEIFRVDGSRTEFAANVNGSILGTVIQNKYGDIGTTQSVSIDILRTH
jgi:hypothetical protein